MESDILGCLSGTLVFCKENIFLMADNLRA